MTNPCCESSDLSRKWPFPNTQLAPPEPVAWTERSHQVSSQTHLPDSPALAELGGLENLLHLRGEYGSRQRSLPPRSQLEVDTLRRQIRRIHRALENSPPPAQSRFPLVINDLEPNEQLIRHGRARPLTSPALPRLQSDIDNRRQFPNQNNVEEPKSRVSALHPQYLDLPPPIYSVRAPG